MASLGTNRLNIVNDQPSVEKLWNDRYRLEFYCDNDGKKTDWYFANVANILPDFKTIQGEGFGESGSESIAASKYPDMRLVGVGTEYVPAASQHYVKLTYETLTAAWVLEKDEDTDYELNGLKRISRTLVALPDTAYTNVVGTSTITSDATTLYLGSYRIEETDAKWTLSEMWLESGELSRSDNFEDGKESVSITQIGGCASAPVGYTVVDEKKDNTQGFETCTRTFYKDDSVLSQSNDYVGSQLAEVIEVFNPSVQPTPTNNLAVLGSKSQSNVDGIPTTRYTFLVPSVLSESEDMVGSQKAITIEAFNETPATPSGYVIANEQDSDVEGIPTNRYTFLKPSILSRSEDKIGSQKAITIEAFSETPSTPAGYNLANTQESDYEGIKTSRYTFLEPSILSQSEDKVGSQLAITIEAFNEIPSTPGGYVIANTQDSDVEGIPTKRYTFLKPSILSETEDKVGSQNSIVIETFSLTPITPASYVLANTQVSDVAGIPTRRYTFLKPSVLSRNVDTRNNGKLKVETVEAFNKIPTSTIGGVQISIRASDVDGIPTNQYVFALGIGEVERSSQSKNQGALTITTVTSLGFAGTATGIEIEATTREEDGYILFRNIFADGNGEVSRTVETRNQGALTVTTVEALGSAGTGTGVEIEATTREQDGYTLFRNTFATGDGEVSRTTEIKNKGALTITTVEALGSAGTGAGVEIEATTREQDGYTLFRNTFAEGNGEVLRTVETRNQGKLTITTVEALGTAGTGTGVEVEATTREQDGYTLFRNVFAEGQGEVSKTTETRNQGKLIITTVEALGTAGSAIGVGIEATTREQDGYTLFRNVFADGQGEVSRSTETRNQGALTVTTVEALGAAGSAGGIEIEATTREQDGYTLFSNTFADGSGEVSRAVETRNQGKLIVTTVEALGTAGTAIGVEIESTTREQDGYTLFRNTFADGQGEVSRSTEYRNQGALTITTVEALGSAGTGTGVEIEATTREQDGYILCRNVFAAGVGEVSRTTETRNQGALIVTTVEALGAAGTAVGFEIEATTREQDGYTLFRNTFADGNGEVSRTVETRNQGKLTVTTIESLGSAGTGTGVEIEATTREQDGYTLFRNTFAQGTGVISEKTDKQYQGTLQIVTTTALGVASGIDNISSSSREEDGYTIFTNVGATGDGEISNSTEERNQGKLKINRIVSVGTPPTPVGTIISRSERKSDGHTVYDYSGALGEGQIFISQSAGPNNIPGTTQRTIRSLGAELIPDGVLIDSQDIVRDGYIEYIRTTLDGAIEGVKTVYADVATVEVPGTVACITQAVSAGDVSGTIAITNSVPRRQKQVKTQVTIEISTTPPTDAVRAYDLGAISCSVTSVQTKLQSGDGSVATAVDGGTTQSRVGYQRSLASSASIQHYPGSYLTSSSSSGSVSYQSSEQPYLSSPNQISFQNAFSSASSTCTGTGSTVADGYLETGVISRSVSAVLTALDGTTYYQVITEEAI